MDGHGSYERIDTEIANGRLWRAKQALQGRLRDATYDTTLFRRYGDVLAAMRDDDEAGRYYLLAGATQGEPGRLARAFLARRQGRDAARIWDTMPKAARRSRPASLPIGMQVLLREAGREAGAFETLPRRRGRKPGQRATAPPAKGAIVFAWMVVALLSVVVALGFLRTIEIGIGLIRQLL